MADTAPLTRTFEEGVPAVGATADGETEVGTSPFAGVVSAVSYIPATVLTGANTDSRTLNLVNKGQSGSGTAIVASKAFTSGVNAPADDETTITLSATAADLVVADGDVLVWVSTHVGSSGLADPGGLAHVEITRS